MTCAFITNLPNDLTNTHGIIYNFQKDLYYNKIKSQTMKKIIETINHHHVKLIEKKLNLLLKRAEYIYYETNDNNNEYIVICNKIYKLLKNKSDIVDIGYSYHSIYPEKYKSFIQIVNQSYFHAWCFDDI